MKPGASIHIALFTLLLGTLPFCSVGQSASPRDFDRDRWRELTEGISYVEPAEEKKQEAPPPKSTPDAADERLPDPTRPDPVSRGLTTSLKLIAIVVVLALLGFLIKAIVDANSGGRNRRLKKGKGIPPSPEEVEENPMEADLESLLEQALQRGDYLWAVRLYYLQILKELSGRNMIRWQKDKTNGAYLQELEGQSLYQGFLPVTRTFERLWYGSAQVDRQQYQRVAPAFRQLLQRIRQTRPQAPRL